MASFIRYLLVGGLIASGVAAARAVRSKGRQRKVVETRLDEALEDTFPASDPTATQDFAIPVNRL